MGNKFIDGIALTIAIIGAVNWGLIGFFDFNLVAAIFGSMTWLSRIIYALVGVCGLYLVCFYMRLGNSAIDMVQAHTTTLVCACICQKL